MFRQIGNMILFEMFRQIGLQEKTETMVCSWAQLNITNCSEYCKGNYRENFLEIGFGTGTVKFHKNKHILEPFNQLKTTELFIVYETLVNKIE